MKKRRTIKASSKRKSTSAKKSKPVRKVALPKAGVVRVVVPKGVVPTIVADPAKGIVEIVPVPVKKTWWQTVMGS